jgi:hypothetical protein
LFEYFAFDFVLNANEITPAQSTPRVTSMAKPSKIGRMLSIHNI